MTADERAAPGPVVLACLSACVTAHEWAVLRSQWGEVTLNLGLLSVAVHARNTIGTEKSMGVGMKLSQAELESWFCGAKAVCLRASSALP